MSELLENQFTEAMKGIYTAARELPKPYHAPRFFQMVCEHGGKNAAVRLLATGEQNYQSGLEELYHRNALHLSVEYLVLSHPWRTLFDDESPECLHVARSRLLAFGCDLPPENPQ